MSEQVGGISTRDEIVQRVKAQALAYDKIGGCSQSVLLALQEEFGIGDKESYKSATNLSGGIRQGGTCGAILGALMGLGLVFGRDSMEDIERAYEAWDIASDIINRFKQELQRQFGFDGELTSTLCPDIQKMVLGRSFDMRNERQTFYDAGGHSDTACPKACSIAAQVGAEKILEIRSRNV